MSAESLPGRRELGERVYYYDGNADTRSELQYANNEMHLVARRNLYKYAVPPLVDSVELPPRPIDHKLLELEGNILDIERLMVEYVPLNGDERILDAGAGSAVFDIWLRRRQNHRGEIVAFERSEAIAEGIRLNIGDWPGTDIKVVEGDVQELHKHFEAASFDVVYAKYLLYHVGNPLQAFDELAEVIKPGGWLVVSGREYDNMQRLWQAAPKIADYINQRADAERYTKDGKPLPFYSAPQSFYLHFNQQRAEMFYPRHFENYGPVVEDGNIRPFSYRGELHIPSGGREEYAMAALSLSADFLPEEPPLELYMDAVDNIVLKTFEEEVAERGYFTEFYSDWFARYRRMKYSSVRPFRSRVQTRIPGVLEPPLGP
jgi:SAM-dependent methyltransferase